MTNNNKTLNPILFLMSLGAGGLSIAFWVSLNFTIKHGKGLIKNFEVPNTLGFLLIEGATLLFALIHFVTLFYLMYRYFIWRKTENYKDFMNDPLRNNAIMGIFLAIDMSLNIFFMVGNYFLAPIQDNFQVMMLPGLIGWGILYVFTMGFSLRILKISFTKEFDINKMHFGFLVHPFSLSMLSITGLAIAGFSENFALASTAFFLAIGSWILTILLTAIKMVSMFQHHLKNNLPDRNFLPSTFILMPTIMLWFLGLIRIGHYLHNHTDAHFTTSYYAFVTLIPFIFMTWYLVFGLTLIKDYFKKFGDFHVTQWGFICPLVAYTVIGFQMNYYWLEGAGTMAANTYMRAILLTIVIITSVLYLNLLRKQVPVINE